MSLIISKLELFWKESPMNGLEHILIAEVISNQSNIISITNDPIPSNLNNDKLEIKVNITEETTSFNNSNSVVNHTINLDDFNYDLQEFDIEVIIYSASGEPKRGHVRNTAAKEMSRPIL